MSQKIVFLCDMHQARDEEVPGRPYDVAVRAGGGGFRFVTVDLCDVCAKPLADVLADAMEHGRPFNGTPPTPPGSKASGARKRPSPVADRVTRAPDGRVVCPVCGDPFKNVDSLQVHVRASHDMTLREALEAGPEVAPAPALDCPVCGRSFDTTRGLGQHRQKAHGGA